MPNFSRVRCRIKGVIGKMKLPKQYNKGFSPRDLAIFHDKTQGQHHPSMTEKYFDINESYLDCFMLTSFGILADV